MYDYRAEDKNELACNSISSCKYFTPKTKCPFCYGHRQRTEEYPIQQQGQPKNPPPSYTPKLSDVAEPNLTTVESGAITPCIFRFTYIWLKSGISFWSYLAFIGKTSISGWQYKAGQWVYFSVDLKNIKNFICS
jgi:glucan-binding YG repeat protein